VGTVSDVGQTQDLEHRVREVHRCFPSGVAVVTTSVRGEPYGLAVNAFSSVSLEPPLVLVCVKTTAQTHDHVYQGENIGINFLAHDQVPVAQVFATSGGDKFSAVGWRPGRTGVPILEGVSAHLEVEIEQRVPAGTHTIFVGRVVEADAPARPPLVYFDGRFHDGGQLVELEQ
jgi:flavin reductase (DIM6/NTAB) family NADH-FMN oxidoreductase RutF